MTREVKGILGFVSLTIIAITLLCFIFGIKTAPIAIGGLLTFDVMVGRSGSIRRRELSVSSGRMW